MKYTIDHIPKDTPNNRRPGLSMQAETITIHNTGNPTSTARNERNWLTNPINGSVASYHIVIDEHEAIECIPLNENAWHAGDGGQGEGNRKSIGIELCESGNYRKTVDNAVKLVASMLIERGWSMAKLRRHYDWSGKICPRLMYANGTWSSWYDFVDRVRFEIGRRIIQGKATVKVGNEQTDGYLIDDTTYVPIRFVSEALGAKISWDNKTKTATISK